MRKLYLIFLAVIVCLVAMLLWPEQRKSGYVNIQEVFNQFEYTKQLKREFDIVRSARQNKLDSLNFELKVLAQKLQTGKNNELAASFEVKRKDYLYSKEMFEEDNQALSEKYDDQIHNQMQSYIVDFGKDNNYDYVFGTEELGAVLFAREQFNLTDEVVKYINKRFKAKK